MGGCRLEDQVGLVRLFADAALAAGCEVSFGVGGYSNGPFEAFEVTLPNGYKAYVEITESEFEDFGTMAVRSFNDEKPFRGRNR